MFVHAYYEEDPRVRREAETLVAAGRPVDVYALRRPGDDREGELAGVRIRRLNVQRHQGAGIVTYLREYISFACRAGWAAARAHRRRRYALAQVHSLPDFLIFGALPLRLAGVPLLLDLHEAMPEFFRMRFPRASNPVAHRLLRIQETLSIALATHVVTVNEALAERLVEIGVAPSKVGVVPNSPALARFDIGAHPQRPFMADGVLRLTYAGGLTPTYEMDILLDAVARVRLERPGVPVHLDVFGRGDSEPALRAHAAALGIQDVVTFHGRIPLEAVPGAIAGADIGLAPTRRDPFTDLSLSTKILEYGAMGRPVVASRLPMVVRSFPADTVLTYEPGDAASLAGAILHLVDDPAERAARVAGTAALVRDRSWERAGATYVALVESLATDGLSSTPDDRPDAMNAPAARLEDA